MIDGLLELTPTGSTPGNKLSLRLSEIEAIYGGSDGSIIHTRHGGRYPVTESRRTITELILSALNQH